MLKRFSSFVLICVLMVSTIGVQVSVQWCGAELVGVKVNGMHFVAQAGQEMGCCAEDDGANCGGCHHVSHQYQIDSQYLGGGLAFGQAQPTVDDGNAWWHACLCATVVPEWGLADVQFTEHETAFSDPPPRRLQSFGGASGLRAPPVWA